MGDRPGYNGQSRTLFEVAPVDRDWRSDRLVHQSMRTYVARETRTHFSELLDLVALGERITITRRGAAVAMLVPLPVEPVLTPEEAAASLRHLRTGVRLAGLDLRKVIEDGQR